LNSLRGLISMVSRVNSRVVVEKNLCL